MAGESIKSMAERLKCTYIKNCIDPFLEEAAAEGWGTAEALAELLSRECETRRINGIRRRMQRAHFPYQMRFEMFADSHLSPEVRREVRALETMAFLDDESNVVLVGNPGVGKTALSVAMGTKACETERTVAFINVPNLVIEMKEAMSLNQLTAHKKSFEKLDLVILDDLGYCSFSRECGEVLFNLLSSRNGKGSTAITTTDQAPLSLLEASRNHPSPAPNRKGPGSPWCDNASHGYASRTLRRTPGAPGVGQ